MKGYVESNLGRQARSRRHRQRHFARRKRRGRICLRPETAVLFAARIVAGVFYSRKTVDRCWRDTHGKTTTTSLLTWVFEHNGLNPSFLIGGIPNNFNEGARFTDSPWFILEGDEYDTAFFDKRSKFIHYLPEAVIINNVEFDHADIFEKISLRCRLLSNG